MLIKDTDQQRGAALIESLLAYPLLLILCLGLFDLIRMSAHYSTLTVIAREGIVVANSLKGMPTASLEFPVDGVVDTSFDMRNCFDTLNQVYQPARGYEAVCATAILKLRLARLVTANGYTLANSQYTAKFSRDLANQTVRIELAHPFRASVSALNLSNIKCSAEGPYES